MAKKQILVRSVGLGPGWGEADEPHLSPSWGWGAHSLLLRDIVSGVGVSLRLERSEPV